MLDNLIKLSLFYDVEQTKREMFKEFKEDLKKDRVLQDPVTVLTYETLSCHDKVIVDTFANYYRKRNNTVFLSHRLNYSCDGIKRRIKIIIKQLESNIINSSESVQKNEVGT